MSDVSQIDGSAVRLKREAQGWALADMANRACLSVKQIRQIEEGGMTAFYSESVKLTAARKVAALLQMSESQLFGQQPAPTPPEEDHFQHVSAQVDTPKFSASMAAVPAPASPLLRGEALHELAQPPAFIEEGSSQEAPAGAQGAQTEMQDASVPVQPVAASESAQSAEPVTDSTSAGSGYMMKIAALFVVALAAAALLNPNLLDNKTEAPATTETPAPPVLATPPSNTSSDSAPTAAETPAAPSAPTVAPPSTTAAPVTTTPAATATPAVVAPAAPTAPASGQ